MALSQIQCLDDHNVNWRVSEGKPEFFYSEDQRLALEALLCEGRAGFTGYLSEHGVRCFLSDPELERVALTVEAYRPGCEHTTPTTPTATGAGGGEVDGADAPLSLQYWPDRSESSVAELDLGWPESISYRGVTRVTVHTQPPVEGNTHIKEVVRKSIASAQKVIAVVMDVFTDVDIFRDLLDASYKRKIPVYIILDPAAVPCFLSMCSRADMHRGHLKNLRVRCCGGVEFHTRSAQKLRGSLSQRFILVDGDRTISGSYSFTWTSSRLDRNLITVVTGQAVETFDHQFRDLYLTSRGVSLTKVPMVDEPVPEPIQHSAPAPVSAAVARKLINPKYALVSSAIHASPASSDRNSSNKNSNPPLPAGLILLKGRVKVPVEAPPLHPGLAHLEKAYLVHYLPTWPEPDPPSDVIGFINIRDEKRANQVHLQRSERFEVSQAIRFSSPFVPRGDTVSAGTDTALSGPAGPVTRTKAPPGGATVTRTDTRPPELRHAPRETDPGGPQTQQHTQQQQQPTPQTTKSQAKGTATPSPEAHAAHPPVPKPRTLQLVLDPGLSEQSGDRPELSLIKKDQSDTRGAPDVESDRSQSKKAQLDEVDSVGDGSEDSTKVICAGDEISSVSTASEEEFYDCDQLEHSNMLANGGATTGSGRGHPPQGDGVNMMARLSQSMLELRRRSQTEDGKALLQQSQLLRGAAHHRSPHRHIGQLFQGSRSPGREGQQLRGAKVVIAKPGSYHRPARASGPVIGGHRYWQGPTMSQSHQHQDNTAGGQFPRDATRSSRSPRRHSPGYRRTGLASQQQQQPQQQQQQQPAAHAGSGLLGVSFSKLSNLRHLRPRGFSGSSPKKTSQGNKDVG